MHASTVLLIDDDLKYGNNLSSEIIATGFHLIMKPNLKDGMETLAASRRIKAVILDGHCRLDDDQPGEPKTNFVFHALQQIRDLEHEQNRLIPFCICSEKPEAFGDDLSGIAPVFRKNEDHPKMFEFLHGQIRNLPDSIIRHHHHDIFENIELVYDDEEEDLLIDLIQAAGLHDPLAIDANLASLRRLLEKLADRCYSGFISARNTSGEKRKGGFIKLTFQSLGDRYLLPRELMKSAFFVYSFCSEHGSHADTGQERVRYIPGNYAYQRVLFTFLELLAYCLGELAESRDRRNKAGQTPIHLKSL